VLLIETSEEAWRRTLEVNVTGTFLVTKAVANALIRDGRPEGRKIVLICALGGIGPYPGSVAYCASKHAVAGLGKTIALELAKYKITVNLVHPGPVETNLRDEYIRETSREGRD
jgi:meso-butanediol dehydrogenase/(S,S)-butanediol dehydrogenase/diacetyl reductase